MKRKNKVMIFDSKSTGHRREYFNHIVKYLKEEKTNLKIKVVAPSSITESVENRIDKQKNIESTEIGSKKICYAHSQKSFWRRSLAEWRLMKKYAESNNIDHCILLDINYFQFALGLPSAHQVPFTISGIYFFPFVRLNPSMHSGWDRFQKSIRFIRKWAVLRWMVQNPNLETVFVLNDPTAAEQLNERVDPSEQRFQSLPDPVASPPGTDGVASIYDAYNLNENRHTFLLAGTISRRKGVFTTLDAFRRLGKDVQGRCALILAGRLEDEDADKVTERVEHLRENTDLEVQTDFRFLSDAEFYQVLSECDTILIPHQRTEGSSGLLGHAALVQGHVIGPRSGLIGELIDEYELGLTVDTTSTVDLAYAAQTALRGDVHLGEKSKTYIRERSPKRFAERVLKSAPGLAK